MEIGHMLKEEREAQQLTLDDIQEMTKIQKRYLQAIEDNNFSSLPGRFYARAFIKEYAIVLNMDYEALLQQFDQLTVNDEEDTTQYTQVRRTRRMQMPKGSSCLSLFPTIIVIVLIVGVLLIAWMLTQKALTTHGPGGTTPSESDEIIRDINQSESQKPVSDEEEDEEEEVEEEEELEEDEFEVNEVGTGNSPESELTFYHTEDELILTFDVTADAYVSIVGESGTTYFDGILQPNATIEPFDLSDQGNVFLNIGNTSGLTVKINDTEMEYPVDPNERVHQKLLINFEKRE